MSKEGGARRYELCNSKKWKLTRDEAKVRYVHNERKTRGHANKDLDSERTSLNYYFKKNELEL